MSSPPSYKCVLLVRKDLQMSKGKMISQCGHAISASIRNSTPEMLQNWCNDGEPIITLQVPTLSVMNTKEMLAERRGIKSHIVVDAGRTEVKSSTPTVCVLGPDNANRIDKIIKDLKLL